MRWKDWGLLEEVKLEPLAIPGFLHRKRLETVIWGLKLHLHFPYRRKCANQLCKSDEGLGRSREKNGSSMRKGRIKFKQKGRKEGGVAKEGNKHHNDNDDNSSSHDPALILRWALCSKREGSP